MWKDLCYTTNSITKYKESNMNNYIEQKFNATISDVDFNFEVNLVSLMEKFQLLATNHSKEMGLSYFDLKENDNAFWVLSKIQIKFVGRSPKWGNEFSIFSYPLEPTNVKFGRNFKLKDCTGNVLAVANSEWCILDAESHRIRRSSSITSYPQELKCLDEKLGVEDYRVLDDSIFTEDNYVYTKTVRTSDLDMNMHMNNVVYTKVVLDSFYSEKLKNEKIREYELHFLKEAPEGAEIKIYKKEVNGEFIVVGKDALSSSSYFRARIKF